MAILPYPYPLRMLTMDDDHDTTATTTLSARTLPALIRYPAITLSDYPYLARLPALLASPPSSSPATHLLRPHATSPPPKQKCYSVLIPVFLYPFLFDRVYNCNTTCPPLFQTIDQYTLPSFRACLLCTSAPYYSYFKDTITHPLFSSVATLGTCALDALSGLM